MGSFFFDLCFFLQDLLKIISVADGTVDSFIPQFKNQMLQIMQGKEFETFIKNISLFNFWRKEFHEMIVVHEQQAPDQILPLVMSQHKRLGDKSLLKRFGPEIFEMIKTNGLGRSGVFDAIIHRKRIYKHHRTYDALSQFYGVNIDKFLKYLQITACIFGKKEMSSELKEYFLKTRNFFQKFALMLSYGNYIKYNKFMHDLGYFLGEITNEEIQKYSSFNFEYGKSLHRIGGFFMNADTHSMFFYYFTEMMLNYGKRLDDEKVSIFLFFWH